MLLQSPASQKRLNLLVILSTYADEVDVLDLHMLGNNSIPRSDYRRKLFCNLYDCRKVSAGNRLPRDVMWYKRGMSSRDVCPSVCLFVRHIRVQNANLTRPLHIFVIFSSSFSHTILFSIPYGNILTLESSSHAVNGSTATCNTHSCAGLW